jgi:hypothetical protein
MEQNVEQKDNKEIYVNLKTKVVYGRIKEGLAKSNMKQYPKRLHDELLEKNPLSEKTGNQFDKNNYSFDRKTESLLLYSNTPGTGPLLERYNETQMPIKYSLKFSSISFQNLLLCLPSNYTYCV